MPAEPSKYASNQFDVVTERRFPLMSEILSDSVARLTIAVIGHAALASALTLLNTASTNWSAGETVLANAEAAQLSGTAALVDKLDTVTRKPDIDTNSLIEAWESTIRSQVPFQGTIYTLLLPHGRETLTAGGIEDQLDALRDFGTRLTAQVMKPTLVSLGTTVTTFATAARALRTTQLNAIAAVENARVSQELLRIAAAAELYNMAGLGMQVFKLTPALVDTLFDVHKLRGPALDIPVPPADTLWTPATRTLSTTALPPDASRIEAWRQGPGSAPERLAVGAPGDLSVEIPAIYIFDHLKTYDLWLQARNGEGTSLPGPKTTWTAP